MVPPYHYDVQEVMEPVKEVGSPESEKTFHKSQSVQCTSEGSEECGTRLFAQGRVLCDTDMHSLSLDSGMVCVCVCVCVVC